MTTTGDRRDALRTVLATFEGRTSTESAVEGLIDGGIQRSSIGVIWRDQSVRQPEEVTVVEFQRHFEGPGPEAGKGAVGGLVGGGVAGAGTVLLASAGVALIPGLGAVLAAGTAAAALAAAAAGAIGGGVAGGLIGALLGASDRDATEVRVDRTWYQDVVESRGFVLTVDVNDASVDRTVEIMRSLGGQNITVLGKRDEMRQAIDRSKP